MIHNLKNVFRFLCWMLCKRVELRYSRSIEAPKIEKLTMSVGEPYFTAKIMRKISAGIDSNTPIPCVTAFAISSFIVNNQMSSFLKDLFLQ